ncbi:MAG: zinc-binding alcohol dehydrogenase [Bacteroidota bacterium]
MTSARALWHVSAQQSELRATACDKGAEATDAPLLRSEYSLISTGTERLVATGLVGPALYESMRVPHMEGRFDFPVKYGYSLVARVVEQGHSLLGKLVHLLHPHQDYCRVPVNQFSLVPEGINAARATLASNLETAVNAVWDGQVQIGDKVLVVGFGIIGALLCEVLRQIPGVELHILEKNNNRITFGREMGFQIAGETTVSDFDLAFNTSINAAGLQSCIDRVGQESRVVELSWYGTRPVQLQLGQSFHQQRKQIVSSQVSQIAAPQRARWDYARRKQLVFELLRNERFDRYLTHRIPFGESPAFFEKLRNEPLDGMGYYINYNTAD